MSTQDKTYAELFLRPLRECASYKPQLGGNTEEGVSVVEFTRLYGADPFYSWIGLNSPAMYAAHKAAGGITSIYRQLGIGCERLVRHILQDQFILTPEQVKWGYQIEKEGGGLATLTLDARVDTDHLSNRKAKGRVSSWLRAVGQEIGLPEKKTAILKGAVFEVRQGYKSADSKRQNADLRNALHAYSCDYLPVVMVVSSQINRTVQRRYKSSQISILVGTLEGPSTQNTFQFFQDVVGYDLRAFFERNQAILRTQVEAIILQLLSA